jgi:hypothetical protein
MLGDNWFAMQTSSGPERAGVTTEERGTMAAV